MREYFMKIAYVIPRLMDSGLGRIPFWLSEKFYPEHDVKVFFFDDPHPNSRRLNYTVPVKKISFFKFCRELNNYDVVHSHGLISDVYVARYRKQIKSLKVTTIHGYHFDEKRYDKGLLFGFIFGSLQNLACKQMDIAICISQTMEQYYKRLGFKNTTVIYNGINKIHLDINTDIVKSDPLTSARLNISTVSILNKRKGVDQIIKLLLLDKKYFLTAVGGNAKNTNNLQKFAELLGVSSQCVFSGDHENPWIIASNCDVFIFPSRSEGLGLALLEAASLGIPIICSDIPTFREIFGEDEVTFFKLDDIDDLNKAILKLEEISKKAVKAKVKVDKKFTLENMCCNYYQTYTELIRTNKRQLD
jgi:glycosyltransferase involved in cell wall biosynthesis